MRLAIFELHYEPAEDRRTFWFATGDELAGEAQGPTGCTDLSERDEAESIAEHLNATSALLPTAAGLASAEAHRVENFEDTAPLLNW